jgi:hypothetical protein
MAILLLGTTIGGYAAIHAGNIASQSVNYANTSGSTTGSATSLLSPNGGTVVAADSAMPASGHSFIHTLALGPGGNDGHILGMTWSGTTSVYGAQIWLDTDPTKRMAVRGRTNAGVWTSWAEVLTDANYNNYAPTLTGTNASGTWGIDVSGTAQYFANNYIGTANANSIWRAGSYTFFNGVNVPAGDFGLISFPTWSSTDANSRYNLQLGSLIGGPLLYRSTNISGAASWATMLSDANYNSYSPTLTGTGASGTWGISITGNSYYSSYAGQADTLDGYDSSSFVKTLATLTGNIDSDYGECFVTFDPIPSGTPPLSSPNIRTINVGNSYSRRTQLAFDYASDTAFFRRRTEAGWFTWREFIHSGNIGSQSVSYATTAGSAPNGSNVNNFYDATAGNGYGFRFWSGSDAYKISMGASSLYYYGPVTDYSIKMQMNNEDTGRGFTWGRQSFAPIAALNSTSGDMQIAGSFTANLIIKSGGTSSQFLKADGTVDSTAYVPPSRTLTINGVTQDLSASRSFTVTASDPTKLPLAGGTLTGALIGTSGVFTSTLKSRKSQTNGNYTTAALWTESYDETTTGIAFHISGILGKFLEMRMDGILYWHGDQVVTNSGTWAINVTGSSATTGSISGYNNPAVPATGSTIVYRDPSGHIYGYYGFYSYINTTDDVSTGAITHIIAKFGDNYHRSATAAKVQAFLGLGSNAYTSTSFLPLSGGTITGKLQINANWGGTNPEKFTIRGEYPSIVLRSTNQDCNWLIHNDGTLAFYYAGQTDSDAWTRKMYINSSGVLYVNDSIALTAANYNSYSPTLTGTGASGTWGISVSGNAGTVTNGVYTNVTNTIVNGDATALILYGAGTYNAAAALHLGGWSTDTTYARIRTSNGNLHLDSRGATGYDIYFNHYSGGDMYFGNGGGTVYIYGGRLRHSNETPYIYNSGTWGISTTGNAATATYATNAGNADTIDDWGFRNTGSNSATAPDTIDSNGISYTGVALLGQTDGALYSQRHSTPWQHQIFGDYRTGQIAVRGKNNGTWQAWRTVLDSVNYTSYSPSLTGSGATGTWGISITGNSATTSQRSFSGDISTSGMGRFTGWYNGNAAEGLAAEIGVSGGEAYIIAYNRATAVYGTLNLEASNSNLRISGSTVNVTSGTLQQGGNQVLHAGNYNSYAPTLTGTGASGTWGISITGNAVTANSAAYASNAGNAASVSSITSNTGLIRDRLAASANIDALTTSNFRTTLFGASTSGYQISTARWNTTPTALPGQNSYGTMIAWAGADTHGFLALDYSSANATVGGGSVDAITWSKKLAFADGTGVSGTWAINITGNATYALNSTRLYASDAPYTYGGTAPYYMYMNYDGGSYWELKVSPATPAGVRVAYANIAGSASVAGTASQVTINYNNNSNSTYQLLWGDGNYVYGTSAVYVNPFTDVIYAKGGYVSPGNAWGTNDSAFFPNGITTAGNDNWVYGHTYIAQAPANGAGHEYHTDGSEYHKTTVNTVAHGQSGKWLTTQSAGGNYIPYSFEASNGDHSYGIIARFHIASNLGSDRPSIMFSSGYSSTRWNIGYCYYDDQFRVTQNMGLAPNGTDGTWGSERFRIDTSGNTYAAIGGTLYANGSAVITSANIGSQSVNYATTAGTAGTADAVAWANVTSKPLEIFNYDGWVNSPGYNANTIAGNKSGFTYSNNAPYTGPLTHFAASGYGLQFNASYGGGGTGLAFRTRNGDEAIFNPWRVLLNSANYTAYAPSLTGSGASGIWSIKLRGIDNTYANGLLQSGAGRTDDAAGDTWIFSDSLGSDTNKWGIKHNQLSNLIEFWGDNSVKVTVNQADGNVTAASFSGAGTGLTGTASGLSIGGSSGSVAWGNITSRPDWMTSPSLIATHSNANSQVNSGFYENGGGGTNWPSATWYNSINVRHSNQANYHGFQIAMSYYDNQLWFRSYKGTGTFETWVYAISSGNIASQSVAYATNAGTLGTYANTTFVGKNGNTYYQADTWIQFNASTGLYWPSYYGAHLQANDISNYTQLAIKGTKGGYSGIYDNNSGVHGIMYDAAGNGGIYRQASTKWYLYYNLGNSCMGINGTTTSILYGMYVTGAIYSTGDIVAYSDVRKKTDIVTIDSAISKVKEMRGVFYTRIDDEEKVRQVGVIAQEMNEVLPEAVTYASDIDEYGVKYGNIVGVLIEAIKEQQKEIDELKAKLN